MHRIYLVLVALCIAATACSNQPAANVASANKSAETSKASKSGVDRAAEESSLRNTDLAWSAAAGKGDVDATTAFMAEDGSTLSPNVPISKGTDAIRKEWQALLGLKDGTISWEPMNVQVAESGELGYTTGTWKMSWNDEKKGKVEDHGKYLEQWKKTNGKWLCVYDMYSSDIAEPAPAK